MFIKDLTPGTKFTVPGISTVYVCDAKRTTGKMTGITYHAEGNNDPIARFEFVRVNLSSVKVVD